MWKAIRKCFCFRKKKKDKTIRKSVVVPSENPEQKLELAETICQETPETPDINIDQETVERLEEPQCDTYEEPSETPDDTNCQEKQKQELDLGMNNCQENQLEVKFPTPRTYLQILEPTGQDSYGMNYTGWHRKEQLDVSVTIVKDIEKRKDILQEVEVLELIRGHENVIGYYGAYYQRASVKKPHYEGLWISMERWNGVAVEDLIYTSEQYSLHESWIAYICKEVLKGLCHLENKKVIHHDLRPQNIILTTSADVKISDFSSATIGEMSHSTSGRIPYLAPEVLANFGKKTIWYNSKADIWSLGISALQMAEGYYPFSRFPQQKLMKRIMHGPAPVLLWDKWSDNFHSFVGQCLQKDPAWRPSAGKLLSHPFICKIFNERGVKSNIKWHLQ
ncbi:serine/threonine-protein kinase mig-15-like [Xenopus laevis]|uniref:Serine/threonine-protein kinase mig-15-like n=1 Tax=Xenopus laevis TaxID=8355 RepID=A0A8J1M6D3_XENLA|nr:serine/threonine-protein kinase mig-15-like [Xenopus laevis]